MTFRISHVWLFKIPFLFGCITATAAVINGSFEEGDFAPNSENAMSLVQGAVNISGWSIAGGGPGVHGNDALAWIANGNAWGLGTPFGERFLDLAGYHDVAPYGIVSQPVATVPGQDYYVSLWLGTHWEEDPFPVSLQVTAGGQTEMVTAPQPYAGMQWWQMNVAFTALNDATSIQIEGIGPAGGQYFVGLDNVALMCGTAPASGSVVSWTPPPPNAAVPEPATWFAGALLTVPIGWRVVRRLTVGASRR